MKDFQQNLADANRTGVAFLLTDLDVGLTFLDVAEAATSAEAAHRNRANARKAYDAVMHLLKNLNPDEQQRTVIETKLTLLRARLEAVGFRM